MICSAISKRNHDEEPEVDSTDRRVVRFRNGRVGTSANANANTNANAESDTDTDADADATTGCQAGSSCGDSGLERGTE
jgi:hypothetical protein